jgi:hypothetical protein
VVPAAYAQTGVIILQWSLQRTLKLV